MGFSQDAPRFALQGERHRAAAVRRRTPRPPLGPAAGRSRIASADGVETGWTAGEHVLDTDFGFEKNIINDTLTFDLRVDTEKLPNDLCARTPRSS
jgi:hypothetical protein